MVRFTRNILLAFGAASAWAGNGVYFVNQSIHPCTLVFKGGKVPLEAGVMEADKPDKSYRFKGKGSLTLPGGGACAYITVPKHHAHAFNLAHLAVIDRQGQEHSRNLMYFFVPAPSDNKFGGTLKGGAWGYCDAPYHERVLTELVLAKPDRYVLSDNPLFID